MTSTSHQDTRKPLRIALISPSGTFDYELLEQSLAAAEKLNIRIERISEPRLGSPRFLNGSKEERLRELIEAEAMPVDAIWCTRGGCGALEFLHDYDTIPASGPPLVGYSDATILHFLRFYRQKRIGIHGPIFFDLRDRERANFEQVRLLIDKKSDQLAYPPLRNLTNCLFDVLEGELIVMNLISLQSLAGGINPQFFQRKILALEEINEPHYKVYRALMQLKNAGYLFGLKALVMGHCEQDRAAIMNETLIPLALELGVPLFDWPIFGHEKPNWPLLFGAHSRLMRVDDQIFTLSYDEHHDHSAITL